MFTRSPQGHTTNPSGRWLGMPCNMQQKRALCKPLHVLLALGCDTLSLSLTCMELSSCPLPRHPLEPSRSGTALLAPMTTQKQVPTVRRCCLLRAFLSSLLSLPTLGFVHSGDDAGSR